ncbi:CDC48 like protein (nucleomorph) [Guillardia theta]|uniref:CDC48 like protein n=1 Tax=Guillardia theta TaxID=55529 RepID=Q98RU0_GUITH|nr:CDC48 like protein [Guillardia theta]AAK39859.1 CDC48 like protein [Guillardia theta]|mmetsp:Transcript_36517/g.113894  ORF Transcript_36517/g.113894 Transcript_36517/m.113894 type:complete len:607 (-) Transcript_36517:847-2667(-)
MNLLKTCIHIDYYEFVLGISKKVIRYNKKTIDHKYNNFSKENNCFSRIENPKQDFLNFNFNYSKNFFLSEPRLPSFRFVDFIGIENYFKKISDILEFYINHTNNYKNPSVPHKNVIILSGPSGTGKTLFTNALAGEIGINLIDVKIEEFSSLKSKKILYEFKKYIKFRKCLLLIDNIDHFFDEDNFNSPNKKYQNLLSSLMFLKENFLDNHLLFIILENSKNIKTMLKKFDFSFNEIEFKIPSVDIRFQMIRNYSKKFFLNGDDDIFFLTRRTNGLVCKDIINVFIKASEHSYYRKTKRVLGGFYRKPRKDIIPILKELRPMDIDYAFDFFNYNFDKITTHNFSDVTWSEIGGLENTKKVISKFIIEPILYNNHIGSNFGQGNGILINGPPGCGKTMIAKAAAKESGANFSYIKGPEILDKFLGESEKAIRKIFLNAKENSPTIIFFDEFDSLALKRDSFHGDSNSGERIVNQLLSEIDNFNRKSKIFLIAATNRLDIIDKAFLRPGRFDHVLNVNYPSYREKISIFKTTIRKVEVLPGINSKLISYFFLRINFTGADISWIIKKATVQSKDDRIFYCQPFTSNKGLFINRNSKISLKNLVTDYVK